MILYYLVKYLAAFLNHSGQRPSFFVQPCTVLCVSASLCSHYCEGEYCCFHYVISIPSYFCCGLFGLFYHFVVPIIFMLFMFLIFSLIFSTFANYCPSDVDWARAVKNVQLQQFKRFSGRPLVICTNHVN